MIKSDFERSNIKEDLLSKEEYKKRDFIENSVILANTERNYIRYNKEQIGNSVRHYKGHENAIQNFDRDI